MLRRLRDDSVYLRLEELGARLEAGLSPFGTVQRVGAMPTLFFSEGPVGSLCGRRAERHRTLRGAVPGLLERGVYIAQPVRCMFVSTAHTAEDVDATVDAVESVFGRFR